MKFNIIRSKLREDYLYAGEITKHSIRDDKLLVFVEFQEEKGIEYLKSIPIDKREGSPFVRFCEQMGLVDEHDVLDTSALDSLPIWGTIKRTNEGQIFIDKLQVDWGEDEEEDEEYEEDEG